MLIDTHAHLDFPDFKDLGSVLGRAAQAGVGEIITIGIDIPSSKEAVRLAARYPQIYATVGIHPHDSFDMSEKDIEALHSLAGQGRVVAVGEIGLDYFRDYKPHDIQIKCLRQQLDIACEVGLPVVFHIRDAYEDFLGIIPDYVARLKGVVLHCFSGDWAIAEKCLDMGFYLSVPGTVTFPKAQVLQDVVKKAPMDRLLLETDAPYLTPVPYRGKTNEPAYVLHTAKKVAELKAIGLDEVADRTTKNAHTIFGIVGAQELAGTAGEAR